MAGFFPSHVSINFGTPVDICELQVVSKVKQPKQDFVILLYFLFGRAKICKFRMFFNCHKARKLKFSDSLKCQNVIINVD